MNNLAILGRPFYYFENFFLKMSPRENPRSAPGLSDGKIRFHNIM